MQAGAPLRMAAEGQAVNQESSTCLKMINPAELKETHQQILRPKDVKFSFEVFLISGLLYGKG